jgi:hypothetical protein
LSYFQNGKILIPFIGEVTDFENILARKFRDILPGQIHKKYKKTETQEIAKEDQKSLV